MPTCLTLQDKESIAQLQYWLNSNSKYNTLLKVKALPVFTCMKNAALGDVSQNQYSSWIYLVLYLSLNTPPCAIFSVHTCSSALSTSYIKCMVSICIQGVILGGFNSFQNDFQLSKNNWCALHMVAALIF